MMCVAAMLLMLACTDRRHNGYSEFHRITGGMWRYGAEVFFTPVHSDSLCPGRFVVALRHDNSYPYTDIRLEVIHNNGVAEIRDTVDIQLADAYGQWNGSGIGTSFQIADTLPRAMHASGTMVRLRHLMRTDTLRGISQAGLFFIPDL